MAKNSTNGFKLLLVTISCILLSISTSQIYAQSNNYQAISPMLQETNNNTNTTDHAAPGNDSSQSSAISPLLQTGDQAGDNQNQNFLAEQKVDDPWEPMNRAIFSFNNTLDEYFLKPIAELYNKIMPKPLNRGVHNIFENISNVQNIGNDLLQANFYQATSDSWRFLINSTAGIGGTFDVAQDMGLNQNNEDFGLTLARWGYTKSRYLVLPFFGPSTVRDTLGKPFDYYAFSPYPHIDNMRLRYTLYALDIIDMRAQLLQYQDLYEQIALDKYTFVRNAYLQLRAGQIQRNKELSSPYFADEQDQQMADDN